MAIRQQIIKTIMFLLFSSIISCSPKIVGSYCNHSKVLQTTLRLRDNQEFILQTDMLVHDPTVFFETGKYVIKNDSLLLNVDNQGLRMGSLSPLPALVRFRGFFKNNKIIFYGKEVNDTSMTLRKCNKKHL